MKFYLETKRLILRELLDTDLEGMFALDSNATVHKYLGNNPITTKDQAAENIDSSSSDPVEDDGEFSNPLASNHRERNIWEAST